MKHPFIALITDFRLDDVYVGVMKAVILSVNPDARTLDVTHSIPKHNVAAASVALMSCFDYLPEGTIVVAVVDPGVGGGRDIIAASTAGKTCLAPDNGLLAPLVTGYGADVVVRVDRPDLYVKPVSSTFHGRDVFAPIAAHLSLGLDITKLGPATTDYVRLDLPEAAIEPGKVTAEVLWVDSFGNIVTNLNGDLARDCLGGWRGISIYVKARQEHPESGRGGEGTPTRPGRLVAPAAVLTGVPLVESYEAVPPGMPLAIRGSSGRLEISLREANAALRLGVGIGDTITLVDGGSEGRGPGRHGPAHTGG
jgi:S-adenosylmethionine hydrolase